MYWQPRPEWNTVSPLVYGHLRTAISIASHIRSVRMLSAIAYPTAFFVQQPGTVARYTNPSQVRIYVISPTHFTPGLLAVKSRRTRSGREPRSAAGTVVRTFRRGCAAWRALLTHDGAHRVRARLNASAGQGGVDPSVPVGAAGAVEDPLDQGAELLSASCGS